MDNELPISSPQVETTTPKGSRLFIIGIVILVIALLAAGWLFLERSKTSPPLPSPTPLQTSTPQVSQNFQSSYLQKAVSIKAPDHFDLNSLIISSDRLNGIVVKMDNPHRFLVESRDDNSKDQVIPVVTDSQTDFYLLQPSNTPPDGPFSGIKLPGDYSSSIKPFTMYTIQFQVISEATDSASLPWVKDNNGSYIAKAVLLDEK